MSKKDYISNIEGAERRFLETPVTVEVRAGEGEEKAAVIEGYAAVYGSRANLGWFEEEIMPGAFDDVLNDDVRCLINHDPSLICARSKNGKGTLRLSVDQRGLKYGFDVSEVSYVKDLHLSVERKDIDKSSFAFLVEEENWIKRDGQPELRQIVKFKRLMDVSPVTYPAYEDTTVAKRSLEAFKKENTPPPQPEDDNIDEYEARYKFNLNNAKR
jgi:uncharacterized protein